MTSPRPFQLYRTNTEFPTCLWSLLSAKLLSPYEWRHHASIDGVSLCDFSLSYLHPHPAN